MPLNKETKPNLGWVDQPWVTEGRKPSVCKLILTLASYLQLTQTICALVILLFNAHLLPLFFHLFTQVHLLIDGLVEGQYITLETHICKNKINNCLKNTNLLVDLFILKYLYNTYSFLKKIKTILLFLFFVLGIIVSFIIINSTTFEDCSSTGHISQ